MKKPFCCESSRHLFEQYYANQQKGQGEFPVYIGRYSQQGHGLADIFRGLMRRILPIIKALAPHALRAGANVIEDISSGTKWKTAAVRRIPESLNDYVLSQRKQTGSGRRRRRTTKKRVKRRKRDIFS
jgi:hypothetical protein